VSLALVTGQPVPASVVVPAADRAALRDHIAAARQRLFGVRWATAEQFGAALDEYTATVLPAPADRAAVLEEAADEAEHVAESLRAHHEFERSTGALDVMTELRRMAAESAAVDRVAAETPPAETQTVAAVVARVLAVAEVIEANGITWAADSIRRACSGDAERPRTCGNCGQVHASHSLTHFGAPGGPWYCVDRDDCRAAGGLPPRKRPAVEVQPGKDTETPRCVCGDPIQLQDETDPTSWIHSPGSDTPCLNARPS
jgi:hypothetical protein